MILGATIVYKNVNIAPRVNIRAKVLNLPITSKIIPTNSITGIDINIAKLEPKEFIELYLVADN